MELDIKSRRKELGFSQFNLAKKVGVSVETVRKWEHGISEPNEENLSKLRQVINNASKTE